MNKALVRLAIFDYGRQFGLGSRRNKGGRTYLWLAGLTALVIFANLFGVIVERSVKKGIADTLLGRVDNTGIGVRLMRGPSQIGKIKTAFSRSEAPNGEKRDPYRVYPFVPLLKDTKEGVRMVSGAWTDRERFMGRVVERSDPLWLMLSKHDNRNSSGQEFSWKVVLNEPHFRRHFDYVRYRDAVLEYRPDLSVGLAEEISDVTDLEHLYFLNIARKRKERSDGEDCRTEKFVKLTKFEVIWAKGGIPADRQISYLLPADNHLLQKVVSLDNCQSFSGAGGSLLVGIKEVLVQRSRNSQHESLVGCTKGVMESVDQFEVRFIFNNPIESGIFMRCLKESGFRNDAFTVVKQEIGAEIQLEQMSPPVLSYPCNRNRAVYGGSPSCGSDNLVRWDYSSFSGVRFGTVYLESVSEMEELLLSVGGQRDKNEKQEYFVHPAYDNLLRRFKFLDWITGSSHAGIAYVSWGVQLVLALIVVGVVVDRRSRHVGLLLVKGNSWFEILAMELVATVFSVIVGALVVVPAVYFGSEAVNGWFVEQAILNWGWLVGIPEGFKLFYLEVFSDALYTTGSVLAVLVTLTTISWFAHGLRPGGSVSNFLHE